MDMNTIKSAMLQAVLDSGFAETAGLSPNDIEFRFRESASGDLAAYVLDLVGSEEHAEQLQSYLELYGPAVLQSRINSAITNENGSTQLTIQLLPEHVMETASGDEDIDEEFDVEDDLDDEELEDEVGDLDSEDEEEVPTTEDSENTPANSRNNSQLHVLTTPEMHKMAGRLYSTLAESSNMARYVTFLQELDTLLHRYGGLPAAPRTDPNAGLPGSAEDTAMDVLFQRMEHAALTLEEARGKKKKGHNKGRSGLLSAIMKALSGDDSLQQAWDNVAVEDFKVALEKVADKVLTKLKIHAADAQNAEEKAHVDWRETCEVAALGSSDTVTEPTPLTSMVPVMNNQDLLDWAAEAGFAELCAPNELHCTVAYSKSPVDWNAVELMNTTFSLAPNENRTLSFLGDNGALVLILAEDEITVLRNIWQKYRDAGASWDYPDYLAHVTLSYKSGLTEDALIKIRPYNGPLLFGPEIRKIMHLDKDKKFDVADIEHVPVL